MFGNALKELESQYQEERSEFKARPQARKKGNSKNRFGLNIILFEGIRNQN